MSGEGRSAVVGSLVLDRFLIERRIGSGGFGVVYEAWDGRLERPVAVKAIDTGVAEEGRVMREAQAAARLNHSGIVTLYEIGEEEGNALLVTELVDGDTLARKTRLGTLSDREIGEIGADLCEALDHAHARGVVHRDVKPQNIVVTEGGEPHAKLMDFGVARVAGTAGLTAPGDIVGTLAYMAPEQAEGQQRRPRGRRLRAGPDPLRVLGRDQPEPAIQPGRDGAGDRRRGPGAATPPTRSAARADGDDRRRAADAPLPAPDAGGTGDRDRGLARSARRESAAADRRRCR